MDKNAEFFLASSLEKVMPCRRPQMLQLNPTISAWRGTKASVQLVYRCQKGNEFSMGGEIFQIEVLGGPVKATIRKVELIASEIPVYDGFDEDVISKEPGLFPDILPALEETYLKLMPHQYRSLWISWEIPENLKPGSYPATIRVTYPAGKVEQSGHIVPAEDPPVQDFSLTLCVCEAQLPAFTVMHREGFHPDCLASYYGVEVFSEKHWEIIRNFLYSAICEHQVNNIFVPMISPSLDVSPDADRPTMQLVDVYCNQGVYSFGTEKLERYVELCRQFGAVYLELAPLFTQWGAVATPKIMAVVDGEEKQIFGWDVPAGSPEYRKFLQAFIPMLRKKLAELGYDNDHVVFRVTDEPQPGQEDAYVTVLKQVDGLLEGAFLRESIGHVSYVSSGLVKNPTVIVESADDFVQAGFCDFFLYYACCSGDRVPNRHVAMESYRNRIIGVLMYLYRVRGLTHWGFNFYYSAFSYFQVDPYRSNHAEWCFPTGEAYLVYPGPDGKPISSIRAEVLDEALYDYRGLMLLESKTDREYVERLIHEELGPQPITMKSFPKNPQLLLNMRERMVQELNGCIRANV